MLDEPLVLVDIETNGLNHVRGRVIEVAAIRIENGQVVREFRQLLDPGTPLPQFITKLTGITEADLQDAPLFTAIADELHEMLEGAIFVAHNVRFDYSFLKQEFKRVGKTFSPRQLCTVRLSRALYPEQRSHKLQSLIDRYGFKVSERHRAYDDALVLWQFLQQVQQTFDPEILEKALNMQLKKPSLPKGLDTDTLASLPTGPGVYILKDADGAPIYIGKSVNIRQRVASHFMRDHQNVSEFKIAQHVRHITTHSTSGELEALLLESRLIKEQLPLYNKQLRRTAKLWLATSSPTASGHLSVQLEMAQAITPAMTADILGMYPNRRKAREMLQAMAREAELCPKLLGLEKGPGACFLHQLKRCRGACAGAELPATYNQRLLDTFAHHRIARWPYKGPILVQENDARKGLVINQWCLIAEVFQDEACEPVITQLPRLFDVDTYKIIRSYLSRKFQQLTIKPVSTQTLQQWNVAS